MMKETGRKISRLLKPWVTKVLIILMLAACSAEEAVVPDKPKTNGLKIKTMSYNIYGARQGGIPDLAALAAVIKESNPDLVALQEVDRFTERNGKEVDIAKELGEMCGMEYFFAKAMDLGSGEYGDAILSKFPIESKHAFNMGVDPLLGGEQRSVAVIKVAIEGQGLYFASTHLDHLGNEQNRLKQAHELNDIVKQFDGPMILGGDFNAVPDSETISIIKQTLVLGCKNNNCSQHTFSTSKPNRTIDYIFYKGINRLRVENYGVFDWADRESDHFPVVATFNLKQD
ncbi:endonuclease/exonuclease/phosphatase family protein [Echinicola marina]|uniref:endonuclease/exonuclease/phosphatase family protein n=1 Tax=Echinicola marina TaxID=2859768 RepID=UPI001CF655D6|nr:endonuclease/exonuclease/phosphatase family protein [Echinicola marina]UCS92123.1 endonuclease/exonuclease/phosphatase family protein [Echinicola marina]